MRVQEMLLEGPAILRFSFETPTCDQLVLSAYFVACYQLKPDVLLKKPLVAWCFHTDILGGGLSQVIILKIAVCVFRE